MIKTKLEERQMVCEAVRGSFRPQPKDIQRITIDHLIVDWLVEDVDLRLHFHYFVDSTRFDDDEYLEQLRALQKAGRLPRVELWPFAFGEAVLPIIADHFKLSEPGRIIMEWIPELASWDTQIKRVCVVTPPSSDSLIALSTKIHVKLVS